MNWFSFSLAGASSLAVTGIIDKFILGRYVRNPLPYLLALVILQQIFALGILAFAGPGFVYPYSFYALAAGAAQVALWIFTAAYALAAKYILSFQDEWHLLSSTGR